MNTGSKVPGSWFSGRYVTFLKKSAIKYPLTENLYPFNV